MIHFSRCFSAKPVDAILTELEPSLLDLTYRFHREKLSFVEKVLCSLLGATVTITFGELSN